MEWISGFSRDSDRRLLVRVQTASGHEVLTTLADLSADLGFEGARTLRRTAIQLHERTEVATSEYLAGLGRPDLSAAGQPVYAFSSPDGQLLIPAQLLVLATVGSQKQLRHELLSPEGPSALMTLLVKPEGLVMVPTPCRSRGYDLQPQWNASRLEWVQCFPSALAAWSSVHANALRGRMDISPIKARCSVNVRGFRAADGAFLVTSLKVAEVWPEEPPFEFAEGLAAASFLFDSKLLVERPKGGAARAPRKEAGLEGVEWSGAMSDAQWNRVEPLLVSHLKLGRPGDGRPKRKYELRQLVDIMFAKTIIGVPWSRAHPDPKCGGTTMELFYRLTKAGLWGQMVQVLREHG